jgi:hypothetical protein
MSGNRERINPDDLNRALDDENSVVEVRFDYDAAGGSTGNNSGIVFERRPKTPQDDRNLGLIPDLLKQPELFQELIGQMQRGEIQDVTQSTNPRVQELVRGFQERYPDSFSPPGQTMRSAPRPDRNPVTRALRSLGSRIRRILP